MSQKLVPYERYKDSGVEWLGQVPTGWEVQPVKQLFETTSGGTPDTGTPSYYNNENGIPWIRTTDLTNGIVDSYEIGITAIALQNSPCSMVPINSVLIAMYGGDGTIGKFGLLKIDATINQALCAFLPSSCMTHQYLFFFVQFYRPYWMIGAESSRKDPNISQTQIQNTKFCVPPVSEQQRISTFLDKQTSRIDALVREQEGLILLLKEKRQALISHAVTKGLDPNAKMKPSGVEWIGEIPAWWEARKLTNLSKLESGHTPSRQHPEWWIPEECIFPWFSLADVHQLRDERNLFVKETEENVSAIGLANSSARILPAGTVILSRTASVGFSGIIEVEMATTQDFVNFICGDKLNNLYLLYVFRSMKPEFKKLIMGSTHQTIYMPDAAAFIVPVPPLEEQLLIVTYITDKVGEIDELISEAESTITLMQEHRSALISAVVTGKVRVPA